MRIRIAAIGMLLVLSATLTAAMQSGNDLYQQGLTRETAGNIKGAVQVFERIVRDFSSNRTLTAKALLQLGRWSELLGEDQARKYYDRLVREFSNQTEHTEVVAQAKIRLAVLQPPNSAPTNAAISVQALPEVNGDGGLMSVSPDGSLAAIIDYSKGQNLALYDFAKKQTRLLTDLDWSMGWVYHAVWSPDGRRVAYQFGKGRNFELRVTTLDGKSNAIYRTAVDPLPYIQPAGWTSDGKTLIVLAAMGDKTWAMGALPVTGGPFKLIRSLGWSRGGGERNASPRLSPDGRFIAYLEGEPGLRDVHIVSIDGREVYRITDHPADDMGAVWSPDSRHLAFTSNRLGSVSLWTVEVKDGKPVGQPLKLQDGMLSAKLIDWTARGVFYDQQTSAHDLYMVSMDPVEGRPISSPRQLPYSRTGRNVSPAWSPDGSQFAFVSSTAAQPTQRYVVVMAADGSESREFAIPTVRWDYPASPPDLHWFGNGRGLGFSGRDMRGSAAVFRLTLQSGQWDITTLAAGDGWATRTEWNREGSAFYFSRDTSDKSGIFERAVNETTERLVYRASPGLMNIRSLEFSPDHKWLAFREITTKDGSIGIGRILVVDVQNGETRSLVEDVFNMSDSAASPANLVGWTPSGDLVIRRSGPAGVFETLSVPVTGGAPRPIAIPRLASSASGESQSDLIAKWSPDGRWMVLGRATSRWDTFVIENPMATALRATTAPR